MGKGGSESKVKHMLEGARSSIKSKLRKITVKISDPKVEVEEDTEAVERMKDVTKELEEVVERVELVRRAELSEERRAELGDAS